MADTKLQILVEMIDKTAKEFTAIGKNLDKAKINLNSVNDTANKLAVGFAAVGAAAAAGGRSRS